MGRRRARVRAEAAARPRRLAGAVESVESVESVIGAGRPEGERSQSAGATEVASARGAELTTYHNLGYAVIFDGPRAARSQPASATMARAAKDSRGQGWHSGRAYIRVVHAFGSCRAAAARVAHTSGFSGSHGGRVEDMREAAGIATRACSSLKLHAYAAASLVEPRLVAIL